MQKHISNKHNKMIDKKEIKKILVIKNDKIGDMILSTSVFRELKKNFPQAEIKLVASNSNKQIIEKNKNIDSIIVLDYPPKTFKDYLSYIKISRSIKKEKFDIGIDLRGSIINIFFLLTIHRVKYKIGFYNKFFSKFFLDYAYKKNRVNQHVTFQRIDLLNKALNTNSKNYWPEIILDKKDKRIANSFIKQNKLKKFITIAPDASLPEKQWALENWDAIIKYLKTNYPKYQILILGVDKEKLNLLVKKNPYIISPMEQLNLRVVYLLFKKSSLVLAQDGGPMHLAWAGKSNLLALISGYKYRALSLNKLNYLRPLNKNSFVIYKDMNKITLEEVKKAIDNCLRFQLG